ncbi:hypothetical protein NCC49_002312 [Naganishia albida]|nr:hypothetical protein NCC49_002312 [Naganishia albida]
MEDVTPPVKGKDMDPFAMVEATQEQLAQERPVLPAPPPVDNTSSRPRDTVNLPRRINPLKRPMLPVRRSSTPNGIKDSPSAAASANRTSASGSQAVAPAPAQPWPYLNPSAVPISGSLAMDPATRNRISTDPLLPGRRSPSAQAGSDGESPTGAGRILGSGRKRGPVRMRTSTSARARASKIRESPVASGDLGLPLVAAVENGRMAASGAADAGPSTDGVTVTVPDGASGNQPPTPAAATAAGQESPTSDAASGAGRKVRFTENAPPPANPVAMVPTALIGQAPGMGQAQKAGGAKGYGDLSPFLKQYRGELEQQWVRMRDHENATTATVERLTKERDDLQALHRRGEKEIITLKKQLNGAKVKIANVDKVWKDERERAEQHKATMEAAKAELETVQGKVEAIKKELEQRQMALDAVTAEYKAAALTREKARIDFEVLAGENEALEQGNQVLVQEILTLKQDAQTRAMEHAARLATIKASQETEVQTLRTNLETARKELSEAQKSGQAEAKTLSELRKEKDALLKKVEVATSAEETVARLSKELQDSAALLQKEKSAFAEMVNDKNKEVSSLNTALRKTNSRASSIAEELNKLRQAGKDEAARFMKRNAELGKSVEDKDAQLAKLTAEMERMQTVSQSRVKENVTLREKLTVQTGKLEERERSYQALVKDVAALNNDVQQRKTASDTLEAQVTKLTATCRELEQEKERLEASARQVQQDKERLEVDLALKSNSSSDKDAVQREMDALAERVRAEEANKYAEEMAKLRAEKAMLSTKMSSRANDTTGVSTPSPRSARSSSKRRHAEMDESEKRQYAEKVGETFFDPEGICIACRHTRKPDQPVVVPTPRNKQARVRHVLEQHGGILSQFREETRKVSKRHKRAASVKSDAGTPKSGRPVVERVS